MARARARSAGRARAAGSLAAITLSPYRSLGPGTTASRDRYNFAKAISIHFLSRCFETSCVSSEAFLACL